jgi:hypothetical protein
MEESYKERLKQMKEDHDERIASHKARSEELQLSLNTTEQKATL